MFEFFGNSLCKINKNDIQDDDCNDDDDYDPMEIRGRKSLYC